MAVAPLNLRRQFSISSSPSLQPPHHLTPQLFKIPKPPLNPRKKLTIYSSTASDSSPIFLPFLQTPSRKQPENPDQDEKTEDSDDPLLKFFKTRTSNPDPAQEGRISLQKNRRTSWHLASNLDYPDEESEPESETANSDVSIDENAETPAEVAGGVVQKILKVSRALPENVTLGEALERCDFVGELRVDECLEVLRVLGEEGEVMSCLYFFEWMGLRESCLVTAKTCSILFPLLGRAGKGEELLVVFKNLPFEQNLQFRDVRVYNAAISGLLFCGRYCDFEFVECCSCIIISLCLQFDMKLVVLQCMSYAVFESPIVC